MPRGSRRRKRSRQEATSHNNDTDNNNTTTTVTVEEWRHDDVADDQEPPPPNITHPSCPIPPALTGMQNVPNRELFQAIGITEPTELQTRAWPMVLHSTANLVILAPTAAGKTYTYGGMHPTNICILTPTRELTIQVESSLKKLHTDAVPTLAIYGGRQDRSAQLQQLQSMVQLPNYIIAATPGRLLDLLSESSNDSIGTIVLDEADRLAMDTSLQQQVTDILHRWKPTRLILASATWPDKVSSVWHSWLTKHTTNTTLAIRSSCLGNTKNNNTRIPPRIRQVLHVCSDHKRRKKLLKTLEKEGTNSGLIFFATISELKSTGAFLRQNNHPNVHMWHGQLSQMERERICTLSPPFLILATDVAARGIHNEQIAFSIQYDFPSNLEQYIHRCGRIRNVGTCYSFFARKFKALAKDLIALLEASQQEVDPNLLAMAQEEDKRTNKKRRAVKAPPKEVEANDDNDDNEDEDPFPELSAQRIVLKRADNVSDPSSSDDDEEDAGED